MSTCSYAEENDRWLWVSSNAYFSVYVDKNTVQAADEGNSLVYWRKEKWLAGFTSITKVRINRGNQTYAELYTKSQASGAYPREHVFSNPHYLDIYPDSLDEKEANAVCHLLKLPTIYGVQAHSWKWIYSTDTTSYYICTDVYKYDSSKGAFKVYYKSKGPRGTNCTFSEVDLTNHVIYTGNKKRIIVPDSLEEAIYNGAKEII